MLLPIFNPTVCLCLSLLICCQAETRLRRQSGHGHSHGGSQWGSRDKHGHGGLHHGHGDNHHHWYEVHKNSASWTKPIIRVFLWPNLTPHEKGIMRESFDEFRQKTCIDFKEEDWVPWYHWKRWEKDTPYVIIRKSRHVHLISQSKLKLDEQVNRTLMYLSEKALNQPVHAHSRGIALHELTHILGLVHEHQRPDASTYIKFKGTPTTRDTATRDHGEVPVQLLKYPFDPRSVTIYAPHESEFFYTLTANCANVNENEIAEGKTTGRLTFWDGVKVNALYCPSQVPSEADRRPPPCQGPLKQRSQRIQRRGRQHNSRFTLLG